MNGLDLFSGIGGISLALKPWVRTIAYCEQDRYSQAVLLSRMRSGELCHAPIWDDVQTLRGDSLGSWIDIIFGGFPCQDISVAGSGRGLEGERSGLFLHVARLAEEIRPAYVFLENVPAIRTRGLSVVVYELARLGFDIRWTTVSAAETGAPHLRKRWFLLAAHPERIKLRNESGRSSGPSRESTPISRDDGADADVADSNGVRESQQAEDGYSSRNRIVIGSEDVAHAESMRRSQGDSLAGRGGTGTGTGTRRGLSVRSDPWRREWWATEPGVGRVVNGLPRRMDRVRGLGNGVIPIQAREAFMRLAGLK